MSADLYLYALDNDPEWVRRKAFVDAAQFLTSDDDEDLIRGEDGYLRFRGAGENSPTGLTGADYDEVHARLRHAPRVWVGQVSWIKAAMDEDYDAYIPGPVAAVARVVGDGVILTPGLAKAITVAMSTPNRSIYGSTQYEHLRGADKIAEARAMRSTRQGRRHYGRFIEPGIVAYRSRGIARAQDVKRFLAAQHGKLVIAESE